MREIKFRAWHKPTQLMDDVVLIDFYNEKIGILYADPVMQCESIQKYNFNEVELMQYTCLKDKNGKEIYEGDICNCREYECFGKIEWNKDDASFYFLVVMEGGGFEEERLYEYAGDCEVIGNIYENPELMV